MTLNQRFGIDTKFDFLNALAKTEETKNALHAAIYKQINTQNQKVRIEPYALKDKVKLIDADLSQVENGIEVAFTKDNEQPKVPDLQISALRVAIALTMAQSCIKMVTKTLVEKKEEVEKKIIDPSHKLQNSLDDMQVLKGVKLVLEGNRLTDMIKKPVSIFSDSEEDENLR